MGPLLIDQRQTILFFRKPNDETTYKALVIAWEAIEVTNGSTYTTLRPIGCMWDASSGTWITPARSLPDTWVQAGIKVLGPEGNPIRVPN